MAPVTSPRISTDAKSFNLLGWVPILDRYLLKELLSPFFFGVGIFTAVAVSIGVVFDLVRKVAEAGLPLNIAVEVFFLKMPAFIVLAFPMSMLLASLMAYSRLSGDSELTALRSCGVSAYRFVIPALVLSIVVTAVTFVFQEEIVPASSQRATFTLKQALESERPAFQDKDILYQQFESVKQPGGDRDDVLKRLFYAKTYDGDKMYGLTVLDFSEESVNQILTSKSGQWNPASNAWDFFDGTIYRVNPDGTYRGIIAFAQHQLDIPSTPLDLAKRKRNTLEMNIAESRDYLTILRQGGDTKKARKVEVEIAKKYALPIVCVPFGLIGAALGISPNQRSRTRATGFGVSVLVIFIYYMLDFICGAVGIRGVLPPYVAAFTPIVFGLAIGTGLLVKAAR
jgi:lipopolysaccharide export system permease protein